MNSVLLKTVTVATAATLSFTNAVAIEEPESNPSKGIITGRITDEESQILPGATIIIEELHTGVTADRNG